MPNLHDDQPVYTTGEKLETARAAMIMLHGRGADAPSILELAREFGVPEVAYLAPQAANYTWYPNRFNMPIASNEPWLASALALVSGTVDHTIMAGIPPERVFVLGFSQGACLALEFGARNPRRYGGLIALSGALIENGDQPREYEGSLAGTPIFLGCSDVDVHIPQDRVVRSADLLVGLGANVTLRLYPGMGHTVNDDEVTQVKAMLADVVHIS
ncbi:MAG: alpha/beta hydrolase [Anaerolineales bacterium]